MFKPDEHSDLSKLSRDELIDLVQVFQTENSLLKDALFGKKSEKLGDGKTIFDEAESYEDTQPAEDEQDSSSKDSESKKRKKAAIQHGSLLMPRHS